MKLHLRKKLVVLEIYNYLKNEQNVYHVSGTEWCEDGILINFLCS